MTVTTELEDRLLDVLRARTGRHLSYAGPPVRLTGGFWAELVAFSLTDPPPGWPAELVARVMPDATFARKETIVQAAIAAAGFPTPAVRTAGGPDDGLGRAFMVMDRADGAPLLSGVDGVGAIVTAIRVAGQRLGAARPGRRRPLADHAPAASDGRRRLPRRPAPVQPAGQ